MRQAVILEAIRTAIGRRGGQFRDVHAVRLASTVLRAIVQRVGVEPGQVEDVICGCVTQVGEQAANLGRIAALDAGFPDTVPAVTINRACGSSLQAVNFAASLIESGACDLVVAVGVESMTRVPMHSNYLGNRDQAYPAGFKDRYPLVSQGESAQMIAERWGIGREEMDRFSLESHRRAAVARAEGCFRREIVPVPVATPDGPVLVEVDEGIRTETSMEKLAALKPAFRPDGWITAGNSSQISDGAAAVLLAEDAAARRMGLVPRARIAGHVSVGVDPVIMLTGPIPATRRLLSRAGLRADDIDLYECNEAFASIPLAWMRELAVDGERVNVNGGAIALGHPIGATGCRLVATLLHELERRDARRGVVTMCCGGGLGIATLIERC